MSKTKSRILSIILAICMVFVMRPTSVQAAGAGGVEINVASPGDEAAVAVAISAAEIASGKSSASMTEVTITGVELNYDGLRKLSTGLTSLEILHMPTQINIPDNAYRDNATLRIIDMPTVTSIGKSAFGGCGSLASVSLPQATPIGDDAFGGCGSLTSVSLPQATSIGGGAFMGCANLTSISLPKAVFIGNSAFRECIVLPSITLPDSVNKIDYRAFFWCHKLTDLVFLGGTPPTLGVNSIFADGIFGGGNGGIGNVNVWVPTSAKAAYDNSLYTDHKHVASDSQIKEYPDTALVFPTSISTQEANISMYQGEEKSLTVNILPITTTDKSYYFTSDDSTVATVSGDGKVLTNGAGTVTITALCAMDSSVTDIVTITVIGVPTLTSQPADGNVNVGSTTAFTVTATDAVSYQWQKSTDNGATWSNVTTGTGDTTSNYTTGLAEIGDSGMQYRCIVSNPAGSVQSNAVTLTVNSAPNTTPNSLNLHTGENASFAVEMGTGTGRATSVDIASSDTTIATVGTATLTANGTVTVTGVAEGTASINLTWTGGSLDGTTSTVVITVTYLPPITVSHVITLGASGDGTVTGSGTYTENSSATVTATPNAGNSFVNWTENGVGISTSSSYSFAVTSARTLIANFKADDAPEPPTPPIDPEPPTPPIDPEPPTPPIDPEPPIIPTPGYGGRSSSSGGTSKADALPLAGKAFTTADAIRLFNTALAEKPEGQTTLSIKARNYTTVDKAVLAELAALAKKNSVTLTAHFDTVVNKAVTYRISVNPALVTTSLDLTVKMAGNKITMPKLATPVEIAVKLPTGITIENLKITGNGKEITATAKPWLDKNGYLHFTTTGGEILLAN